MYTEERVIEVLQAGNEKELNDLLVTCPDEYSKTIQDTVLKAKAAKRGVIEHAYELFAQAPKGSRKEFALWVNANIESPYKSFMFQLFESKPLPDEKIYKLFRDGVLSWK